MSLITQCIKNVWLMIKSLQLIKVTPYGICTEINEMIFYHFWYLLKGLLCFGDRNTLENQIENKFLSLINKDPSIDKGNVVVTHSCRTIFYCIIKSIIKKNTKMKKKYKICCTSIQYSSFYKILKSIEIEENCCIEFYSIDLNLNDFTINESQIKESQLKECDLILCQNFMGLPFEQNLLFKLGHKLNIPIIEDCVQSGSLFSNYKGHKLSDVCIWSGGLDKTPNCFGAGFGYFRDTQFGNELYEYINTNIYNTFEIESFKDRFTSLIKQTVHLLLAKNTFGIAHVIVCVFKLIFGDLRLYEMCFKVRKNESIGAFPSKALSFMKNPSIYHLYSIQYGLNKNYSKIVVNYMRKYNLFFNNIPCEYHKLLFPWKTKQFDEKFICNKGIPTYTWVYTENRDGINIYLSDNGFVSLINTTWICDSNKKTNGSKICQNLVHLPNLIQMNDSQTIRCAKVLTNYIKMSD